MTIRRFNYTGRQKLLREDTKFIIHENNGSPPVFDAELHLEEYGLPDNAFIFVEAYRQTSWMRFNFGTVINIQPQADRQLAQFDSIDEIKFRVRITSDIPPHGILLAEGDRIPFRRTEEKEENRIPLLPIKPENLGQEMTKVDFNDEPILLVNSSIGDWQAFVASPVFVSLVYPQAFREILSWILRIEEHFEAEYNHDSNWMSRWLHFASKLPGVGSLPEDTKNKGLIDDWINDAGVAFCNTFRMKDNFLAFWRKDEAK